MGGRGNIVKRNGNEFGVNMTTIKTPAASEAVYYRIVSYILFFFFFTFTFWCIRRYLFKLRRPLITLPQQQRWIYKTTRA